MNGCYKAAPVSRDDIRQLVRTIKRSVGLEYTFCKEVTV